MWSDLGRRFCLNDPKAVTLLAEFFAYLSSNEWNIRQLQDYYLITRSQLGSWTKLGVELVSYLKTTFPSHKWSEHRFQFNDNFDWWGALAASLLSNVDYLHSSEYKIVRRYYEELEERYSLKTVEEWENALTRGNLVNSADMQRLHWLLFDATLELVFPDMKWRPWRLVDKPLSWWRQLGLDLNSPNGQTKTKATTLMTRFLEEIASELGFTVVNDWIFLTSSSLGHYYTQRLAALVPLASNGEVAVRTLLAIIYPTVDWKIHRPSRKSDRNMEQMVVTDRVAGLF